MKKYSLLCMKAILISFTVFVGSHAFADDKADLQKTADLACGKIKMCIKKQATDEGNMSPEMLKMIDQIADSSCKSLYQINEITAYDNLIVPLRKCYQAMAESSCADLVDGKQPQACITLEQEVKNL